MKKVFVLAALWCCTGMVWAQTPYTIEMSSGKLIIDGVNDVTIAGSPDASVEISLVGEQEEVPEKARGLRMLSATGLTDNTGLGLAVERDGSAVTIASLSPHSDNRYMIRVPASVSVLYQHSNHEAEEVQIKDYSGEIEVSALFNPVRLENVTGPMAINTVHGDIIASFSSINQSNSITLVSAHGDVDVTIPGSAKADFHLSSAWGNMYTDLDLEITYETVEGPDGKKEQMKRHSSQHIDAKYNGGGVDFSIKSTHSDIFLRKK